MKTIAMSLVLLFSSIAAAHESHWPSVEALKTIYADEVRLVIPGETMELESGTYGTLWVEGTLRIPRNADITALVRTIVIAPGGFLDGGTPDDPVLGNVKIVFRDLPLAAGDTFQLANGLLSFGKIRLHAKTKTAWTRFTGSVPTTENGWEVDDQLYLPDVQPMNVPTNKLPRADGLYAITETGLDRALSYPRLPIVYNGEELVKPIVANLTRNITFASENVLGVKGHCQIFDHGDCDMAYVAFSGMGRTTGAPVFDGTGVNQIGRYPLHLHHYRGPMGGRPDGWAGTFKGIVTDGVDYVSKWGHVVHQSHWVKFEDCISIRNRAGFVTEDGVEVGWRFDHCLAADNKALTANEISAPVNQLGAGGAGFWLRSIAGELTNSVAVNNEHGMLTATTIKISPTSTETVPTRSGGTVVITPRQTSLEFRNNELICNRVTGLDSWGGNDIEWDRVGAHYPHPTALPCVFDECLFGFNGKVGIVQEFSTSSVFLRGCDVIATQRQVNKVQGIQNNIDYMHRTYLDNCRIENCYYGVNASKSTIINNTLFDCAIGVYADYGYTKQFLYGFSHADNVFTGMGINLYRQPIGYTLESIPEAFYRLKTGGVWQELPLSLEVIDETVNVWRNAIYGNP